eukprot:2638913-Rhodomonas_salina.1
MAEMGTVSAIVAAAAAHPNSLAGAVLPSQPPAESGTVADSRQDACLRRGLKLLRSGRMVMMITVWCKARDAVTE